jgi:PEP-CTERM motif-containing protein
MRKQRIWTIVVSLLLSLMVMTPATSNAQLSGDQYTLQFFEYGVNYFTGTFTLGAETATPGVYTFASFSSFVGGCGEVQLCNYVTPVNNPGPALFDANQNQFVDGTSFAVANYAVDDPDARLILYSDKFWATTNIADTLSGRDGFYEVSLTSPVPEPSTYVLMLGGIALLAWFAHRRGTDCPLPNSAV